jgi:hypothetical protein
MNEILIIAVCAYVYTEMLAAPEMILYRWWEFANRNFPRWLFNPIVGCVYCVAGQMSLWYYIYKYWNDYNPLEHVAFICLTIFFVEVIITLKTKTQ